MDLKEQLVVWKKAGYLLDHVCVTQPLCDGLVDEGLATAAMMAEIHSPTFRVEQTLKMLTLLGTHGENVYPKFIRALIGSNYQEEAHELMKTYNHTNFGEMLPPCFTYFLDMSEFLRKNRHIAKKLGEEDKHKLQCFIEGKVEMEHRKFEEGYKEINSKKEKLKRIIAQQQKQMEEQKKKENKLKQKLEEADEEISKLKNKVNELNELNQESRGEIRRLKHFRMEQEQLYVYIAQQSAEYGLPNMQEEQLSRMPTITNFKTGKALVLRLRLLLSQVNLSINKLYYMQNELENLEAEEKKLVLTLRKNILDFDAAHEAKKVLAETRKEKKNIAQQVSEGEKEIYWKEKEIQQIRKELMGKPFTPHVMGKGDEPDSLKSRMDALMEAIREHFSQEKKDVEEKHDKEINGFVRHVQELQAKHLQEVETFRFRIKQKMVEIHKREMLHKRMRNQINVITRYHAKNMNATIPVEQCRKIVRGVIRDVRLLRDIAEEKDKQKEEEEEQQKEEALKKEKKTKGGEEDDDNDKKGGKNKKKKRRKKWNALADERLMFVADRMQMQWRNLGRAIGMTNNRMDMVEYEILGHPDKVAFMMLKMWRDEDHGKAEQLVNGLKSLDRPDLALIVTPAHRVEIIKNEDGTYDTGDVDLEAMAGKSAKDEEKTKNTDTMDLHSAENLKSATPRLPAVDAK